MNHEEKLHLQAYLDNELTRAESQRAAAWLVRDPEAKRLYQELQATRDLLHENELAVALPESHDFYWSKIEKAIRSAKSEAGSAPEISKSPIWLRWFIPVASTAVLVAALMGVLNRPNPHAMTALHELDSISDESSTFTFNSEKDGVTVVWVQSR
jgi:anti-sigma factor RsiW